MYSISILLGAPVVFSQPHFLDADPAIINSIDGVHPNREEHSTVIDLEPVSTHMHVNMLAHTQIHAYTDNTCPVQTRTKPHFLGADSSVVCKSQF